MCWVLGMFREAVRRPGGGGADRAAEDDQPEACQEPEPEERTRGAKGGCEGEDVPAKKLTEHPLTDNSMQRRVPRLALLI